MKSGLIILKKPLKGALSENYFSQIFENLPPIKIGEFLTEAEYISVDPITILTTTQKIEKPIKAQQIAKIIESKNSNFPVGKYVVGDFGWRTHTIAGDFSKTTPKILPNLGSLPKTLNLGILGDLGNTAYSGFLEICKPEPGNTVVISGAESAVAYHVGQIAKIKGCHVVGITSSDDFGQKLLKEFGFDAFVNCKSSDFVEAFNEATPNKIDCYFDVVGGEISSVVLNRMNKFGRVAICGALSVYNSNELPKASEIQTPVKITHTKVQGFKSDRFKANLKESVDQNLQWIQEGKINFLENYSSGFENTTKSFLSFVKGQSFGTALVKVNTNK